MIEQSADIKELAIALLKFQAEVRGVLKDSKNPHFKNRYASLEAVVEAARPGLQAAGIVFMQGPGQMVGNALEVSTMLIHAASGQWIRSTMQIPLAKIDPQGAGSAVTYAQRYSLMAALGIPPVEHIDDDAETAMGRGTTQSNAASKVEVKKDPPEDESKKRYIEQCKDKIAQPSATEAELRNWWTNQGEARRSFGLSQDEVDQLKKLLTVRLEKFKRAA
jgi:hypothetical protein